MGLLGPNGSGKTTALNLMSGVLRPDAGIIRLMGQDIAGLAAYRIARLGLARTFQLVRVLDGMDCRENIKAGLAFQKPHLPAAEAEVRIDMLLDRVGLGGQDRRPAADLTYIDRKRLELARALAREATPVAARRMARRAQSIRTHDRHRPDPVVEGGRASPSCWSSM